jgi:S1-C subfamily serine protease
VITLLVMTPRNRGAFFSRRVIPSLVFLLAGLLGGLLQIACGADNPEGILPPLGPRLLERGTNRGTIRGTFAPAIRRVNPSVVSITAERIVRDPRGLPDLPFFFGPSWRNNRAETFELELGERPTSEMAQGSGSREEPDALQGVSVDEITPALSERYGLSRETRGVIVTRLDPVSRAAADRTAAG